jgi:hypothetical protein
MSGSAAAHQGQQAIGFRLIEMEGHMSLCRLPIQGRPFENIRFGCHQHLLFKGISKVGGPLSALWQERYGSTEPQTWIAATVHVDFVGY